MPGTYLNLLDLAKRQDPDGTAADIVEIMKLSNPILDDLPVVEGNLPTGHRTTLRSSLPSAIWRKLYQGVPVSKSSTAQIEETCGMLEARNEIDAELALLNAGDESFRLSEASAFIQAMSHQMAASVFYGSTANGDPFNGFATRYNTSAGDIGQQVISAGGGASNNTSIYVTVLGTQTIHGIVPKGSKAGIDHKDLGEIDAFDSDNNRFRAVADLWRWKMGLVVRDYRAVVRVANISAADLLTAGLASGTQAKDAASNILRKVVEAKYRIPPQVRAQGRLVAYMNPRVVSAFKLLGLEKSVNALALSNGEQQLADGFDGIKFVECESLLNTEAAVV